MVRGMRHHSPNRFMHRVLQPAPPCSEYKSFTLQTQSLLAPNGSIVATNRPTLPAGDCQLLCFSGLIPQVSHLGALGQPYTHLHLARGPHTVMKKSWRAKECASLMSVCRPCGVEEPFHDTSMRAFRGHGNQTLTSNDPRYPGLDLRLFLRLLR